MNSVSPNFLEQLQPVKQPGRSSNALHAIAAASQARPIFIIVVAGMVALVPIMFWGIPSGGDLPNHYRFAMPFIDSIQNGHWYPGWLAESNYGYGDARFRFYPPGLYYLLALFRCVGSWYSASIAAFTFLSIAGALGTYFWARTSHSRNVALLAGILYTFAPYHLNQIYQASLLSEYAACSVLPFALAFIERICLNKKALDVAGLAAAYALLVLTHLPLTVIGSLTMGLYAVMVLRREKLWLTLSRLLIGLAIGLAASSFFWATMLAELKWIKGNSANQNFYYDYRVNFLFSPFALTNRNTWYANLLALAVIGMILPAAVLIKKGMDRHVRAAILVTVVSLIMATDLSRPLWVVIPKVREVQFPWRWLTITSMFGAVVLAESLPKWVDVYRQKLRPIHLVPALTFGLSVFFLVTQVVWDSDFLGRNQFESQLSTIREAASFKDWQPRWASDDLKTFTATEKVSAGDRAVTNISWRPELRQFAVAAGTSMEARARTFYYPLWKARAGDEPLPIQPAADGAVLISLPAKAATVTLEFVEPTRVAVARIVSICAWLLILSVLLWKGLSRRSLPDTINEAVLIS